MKKNTNNNNKLIKYSTITPTKRKQKFQNKVDGDGSLLKCSNITIKVSTFEECDSSLFVNSDEK